jgi:hypothetical protein
MSKRRTTERRLLMEAATHEHELEDVQRDAELATLYGGIDGVGAPYPMLVQPWEDDAWQEESELDALIFAGLLRLAP